MKKSSPVESRGNLPPWEKIINRLSLAEQTPAINAIQKNYLLDLTNPKLELRPVLAKSAARLARMTGLEVIMAVKTTQSASALIASNISKKDALALLRSPFLHSLSGRKSMSSSSIPKSQKELLKKGTLAHVVPIGERPEGYQLLLITTESLNREQDQLLRLTQNILTLRFNSQQLKEQSAREAESLTLLTHHLSEGMFVLDENLSVTLWNRPMQRLTGFAPREAAGKNYAEVFRRNDADTWLEPVVANYNQAPLANVFNQDMEIIARDGSLRWVSISGSFLRGSDRKIHQIIVIVRDVTRLKILEQRKNEFISIATHELRTPITAIKGYLSLLVKDTANLTEKQLTYLSRAIDANNRLTNLAEDLLRSVQVEEDRLRINLRPVELAPVLEKVCRDLANKAQAKQLSLAFNPPSIDSWVIADEEKVEQVFANLIDNAIKYTNEGSITINLDRFDENGQTYIVTHVADTGIGINSKDYEAIFEKFRRTHNTGQIRESGAGLGLFIVKSFVEKQGGKISVNSKIGKGTTFSVRFPATDNPRRIYEEGENNE